MKEYKLTLTDACALGRPFFNNKKSVLHISECIKNIQKNESYNTMYDCSTYNDNKDNLECFYSIQLGLFTASVTGIKISKLGLRARAITSLRIRTVNIKDKAENSGTVVEIPSDVLWDKEYIDSVLLKYTLGVSERLNSKWWDFLRFTDGDVYHLEHNGVTVGYRLKMHHKMLIPLTGDFDLDMSIDTAQKISYRPASHNVIKVVLDRDTLKSQDEVDGAYVADISDYTNICKDLAVFMYY